MGSSATLGLPVAAASTLGYIIGGWRLPAALPGAVGYRYLPALLLIASASVVLAPLGARTAHGMDVSKLKRSFALLLLALAAYMLTQAWRA